MLRAFISLSATLLFASPALALPVMGDSEHIVTPGTITPIWFPHGSPPTPPPPVGNCPYDGGGYDDGCDALNAAGQIGLYTVNGQNKTDTGDGCNLAANCFFSYARQTSQVAYTGAGGTTAAHPIQFNQPGGDYGIGPWTPQVSQWAALGGPPGGWTGGNVPGTTTCTASSANHNVSCHLTAPNAITGYIASGLLNVSTGSNPTVGQYVWYNVPGLVVRPYRISGGSAGVYTLANDVFGAPPDTGSIGSPVSLYTSTLVTISGGLWDDIYFTASGGPGLVQLQNNTFLVGTYECTHLAGFGPIDLSVEIVPGPFVLNNFEGYDPTCSGKAVLYPTYGATQATFNGTISGGKTLTINSGTAPSIGQFLNGASFTQTTKVLSGTSPNFTLSNTEPNLTETMTSGPIQSGVDTFLYLNNTGLTGGGFPVVEYNYVDKVSGITGTYHIGSVYCKYNYNEIEGIPATHINGICGWEPGLNLTSLTTGATYTNPYDIQDANTVLYNKTSIAGVQNGCASTCASGSGTGAITSFATSQTGNSNTGFYVTQLDFERKNNILIGNGSINNNTSTPANTVSSLLYFDTQGASNPGPYPGSIQATTISNNFFDPTGAIVCLTTSSYVFTTPGGSTTLASAISGNTLGIDLIDGSNVVAGSTCFGQNNP